MNSSTAIPRRRLGSSGLVVSRIALGTMTFGGRTDDPEANRITSDARDRGVNAVIDALSQVGIDEFDMPASPDRVWAAIGQRQEYSVAMYRPVGDDRQRDNSRSGASDGVSRGSSNAWRSPVRWR